MQLSAVGQHVRDNLASVGSRVYVAPNIPTRKLNNAVSSIANGGVRPEEIIGIADITLWGSSRDGFVFTNDRIFIKPMMEPSSWSFYSDLQSVTHQGMHIHVTDKNGNTRKIDTGMKDGAGFFHFLQRLITLQRLSEAASSEASPATGAETVARCSGCNAKFSGAVGTVINCEWCRKPVKFEAPAGQVQQAADAAQNTGSSVNISIDGGNINITKS